MNKNDNQHQNGYIKANEESLNFLQRMSSDFHRLYAEVMREYVEKEMKLIDNTLDFGYKIIQVIGIVAGFGFTALGLVKSIFLFIGGELLLISSIVYGVYQIKRFYTTNLEGMQQARTKVSKLFREKSQLFQDVITGGVKEGKIDITEFQTRLGSIDSRILEEFSSKQDEPSKNEGRFLDVIILLLILGGLALLLSFAEVPLINWEKLIGLFSLNFTRLTNIRLNPHLSIDWISLGTVATAAIAAVAFLSARKAGVFDKTPNVLASGTFIISIEDSANRKRDGAISKDNSVHTLQLINVGRGLARNVVPSRKKNKEGEFLEDICPHSFALPSGKSTRDLGETLRVHGQIFIRDKELFEFESGDTAHFYIDFEDYSGRAYRIKVKIKKVGQADGELEELRETPGIEIWKVAENIKEKI